MIKPYYDKDGITIYNGDCLEVMKQFKDGSIDMIMTSPPYWTQRSYGNGENEIGLENTPKAYIDVLVKIFNEVKRVLKKEGVFWLNIDDVYYGSGHGKGGDLTKAKQGTVKGMANKEMRSFFNRMRNVPHPFLKRKDLCLIPERLIDKLQRQGWWIRSRVIWRKPNAMPENVKDRPTNDYEFLYLLTKSARYFFTPILENYTAPLNRWGGNKLETKSVSSWDKATGQRTYRNRNMRPNPKGRNFRAVWDINTQPTKYDHPAKYPEALCEKTIKCGSPESGIILDPFMGSGTTLVAAKKLGRKAVGIEISKKYCDIAIKRLKNVQTELFA